VIYFDLVKSTAHSAGNYPVLSHFLSKLPVFFAKMLTGGHSACYVVPLTEKLISSADSSISIIIPSESNTLHLFF